MSTKRCEALVLPSDVNIPQADASNHYVHMHLFTNTKSGVLLSKCHLSFVLQSALHSLVATNLTKTWIILLERHYVPI